MNVHIDCHQLSRGITIADSKKTYCLEILIDIHTRLAWVKVLEGKKAMTVMFAVLKLFNMLNNRYNFEIEEVMPDNGAEFGREKFAKNKENHPLDRFLAEMDIKHRYTRSYCPKTNGKIERFWKALHEDFIE